MKGFLIIFQVTLLSTYSEELGWLLASEIHGGEMLDPLSTIDDLSRLVKNFASAQNIRFLPSECQEQWKRDKRTSGDIDSRKA